MYTKSLAEPVPHYGTRYHYVEMENRKTEGSGDLVPKGWNPVPIRKKVYFLLVMQYVHLERVFVHLEHVFVHLECVFVNLSVYVLHVVV